MSVDFHVIIPARYGSTRLPGKLLMMLDGMTVIERVYRQAVAANPLSIIIATDSEMIYKTATAFGANVVMTSLAHQSGTDRVAEVVAKKGFLEKDIIVNVQGDEALISPLLIKQVATSLAKGNASIATLCWPIKDAAVANNPNVVKVVRDSSNHALYFSRYAIPFNRANPTQGRSLFRHVGLYAYRSAFLLEFVTWPVVDIEILEALEQLRVLWRGHKILVEEACVAPLQDINTSDDLAAAQSILAASLREG